MKEDNPVSDEILKSLMCIYLFEALFTVFDMLYRIRRSSSNDEVVNLTEVKGKIGSDCSKRESQEVSFVVM
jgi:hypothetical protein